MTAAAARLMHQTKMMIILSLNAVAILIVGVMIFSAINLNGGLDFKVVTARSDEISGGLEELGLLAPETAMLDAPVVVVSGGSSTTVSSGGHVSTGSSTSSSGGARMGNVPSGELWSEDSIVIFQTADFDICVGGGLSGLGEMYWQTSNPAVINGFYNAARTWLGYGAENCRYPSIVGTGTTVITAGTYDGKRYDKLTVTVIAPPVEQWKRDVLTLVNKERRAAGLSELSWGSSCEGAANTRAQEIKSLYSHTRPNGSSWESACPIPASTGGYHGENLAAGNAAVSPETVVASWMASPEHRANILNPNFTRLAVGFVFDPSSTYKTYWSQYFSTY